MYDAKKKRADFLILKLGTMPSRADCMGVYMISIHIYKRVVSSVLSFVYSFLVIQK